MTGPPSRGESDAPETAAGRNPPLRVFTEEALARLRLRDEPPTAAEVELAGPWRVIEFARGTFGLFRRGDDEAGYPPLGVFSGWHLALLAAAALPGLGRASRFRVHPERGEAGYPLLREGVEVGALGTFLADLAPALDALEAIVRSPTAFALALEAAGPTALERAGRELGLRLVEGATEEEET